jgi:hypothetical protein
MNKINWIKSEIGSVFEDIIEGYVENELMFIIKGKKCITDLTQEKDYKIKDIYDGMNIAHKILNS